MRRSLFLIITSVISALFGGMMFFLPEVITAGFGATTTHFSNFLMREMGLIILCVGILNFLVRNAEDSMALKAIFILNMAYHITMIPMVLMAVSQGIFTMEKSMGGLAAHLFIGIGSIFYSAKIRPPFDECITSRKVNSLQSGRHF